MNQRPTNSEDTITTLFVEILMPMSATWRIDEQTTRPLLENRRKPDVIIRTVERYPLAVEVKIDYKRGPNKTGEKQAREYYSVNRLIAIVFDKGLIPPLMQSHFSALRSTLESGVPTIRNNQSGHGQSPNQIAVPEYIAAYILHLTASNILLLAKADQEMK